MFERKYDHVYFTSRKILGGFKVYWSTGTFPTAISIKGSQQYKLKREPGLINIQYNYDNFVENTTLNENFFGIEETALNYEGKFGNESEFSVLPSVSLSASIISLLLFIFEPSDSNNDNIVFIS